MRALGIPNTKDFYEVTKIEDALALWKTLQSRSVRACWACLLGLICLGAGWRGIEWCLVCLGKHSIVSINQPAQLEANQTTPTTARHTDGRLQP